MGCFVNIVVFVLTATVIQRPSNDCCAAALTPLTGNVAVAVGSNVTFSCRTDRPNPIRWNYRVTSTHSSLHTVYNGLKLATSYDATSRFSVEYNKLVSALAIANVQLSDSGTYSCVDTTGEQHFELIVLGSDAVCTNELPQNMSSASTNSSAETVTTSCCVLYSGNCEPLIHCDEPFTHVSQTLVNQSTVDQSAVYLKTVHFAKRFEEHFVRCTTQFLTNCNNSVGPPSYRHQWDNSISRNAESHSQDTSISSTFTTSTSNGMLPDTALFYGLVIGCLLAVVMALSIVLVFILLQCRKGNRVSRMYSLVRKRERLALPTEPVAESVDAECAKDDAEPVNDQNVYDDAQVNRVPDYNASSSKYVNAPDDSIDDESIQAVVEPEGTESSHYAELPE